MTDQSQADYIEDLARSVRDTSSRLAVLENVVLEANLGAGIPARGSFDLSPTPMSPGIGPIDVAAVIQDGAVTDGSFASSIDPVLLRTTAQLTNADAIANPFRVAFNTDNSKLYRSDGATWTVAVDGGDILAASIIAGKIAAGAIGTTELAALAVTAAKIAAGTITTNELAVGIVGSYYNAVRFAANLISYWRLGEASGTVAVEAGASGYNGTYTGAPTLGVAGALPGDADTAVTFNGTTQYVTVPDATGLDLADAFTIEAWVKRGATGAARAIVSKQTNAYYLRLTSTGAVELLKSGVASIVTSTTTLDTAWHHVAATKNGAAVHLYIDGVDVTGVVTNATCADNASALLIGADTGPGEYNNGTLDEIALYNVALTAAQIRDHANRTATVDSVTNAAGGTVITSSGVAITNGKITVTNPGSVVIIDGTSNMFKIAATGTLSKSQAPGSGIASVSLSALGTQSIVPAFLTLVALYVGTIAAGTPRRIGISGNGIGQAFVAVTSGGAVTTKTFTPNNVDAKTYGDLDGSSFARLNVTIDNADASTWKADVRYYVLVEAGI